MINLSVSFSGPEVERALACFTHVGVLVLWLNSDSMQDDNSYRQC